MYVSMICFISLFFPNFLASATGSCTFLFKMLTSFFLRILLNCIPSTKGFCSACFEKIHPLHTSFCSLMLNHFVCISNPHQQTSYILIIRVYSQTTFIYQPLSTYFVNLIFRFIVHAAYNLSNIHRKLLWLSSNNRAIFAFTAPTTHL